MPILEALQQYPKFTKEFHEFKKFKHFDQDAFYEEKEIKVGSMEVYMDFQKTAESFEMKVEVDIENVEIAIEIGPKSYQEKITINNYIDEISRCPKLFNSNQNSIIMLSDLLDSEHKVFKGKMKVLESLPVKMDAWIGYGMGSNLVPKHISLSVDEEAVTRIEKNMQILRGF